MSTYKQWQAKMDALNAKRCKTAKELEKTMQEMVKLNAEQAIYEIVVLIASAYTRLVPRTPVDTGRARAGWQIGSRSSGEQVATETKDQSGYAKQAAAKAAQEIQSKMPKLLGADIIYILNNVEYILELEAGWSKQSSGFIALMMTELKTQMSKLVSVGAR